MRFRVQLKWLVARRWLRVAAGFALAVALFAPPVAAQKVTATSPGEPVTAKMEDLSPELRERAKALGYKDDETVNLRITPSGQMTVIPKTQRITTPEELQARLFLLVADKIVTEFTSDLEFKFVAAVETEEIVSFTVSAPYRLLRKPLQDEARSKGYATTDVVLLSVDAKTWEFQISAKTERAITTHLEEVIPGKNPGDQPTFVVTAAFGDLSEADQAQAKALGYGADEAVRLEAAPRAKGFKVLPRRFFIGARTPFGQLAKADQREAAKVGYSAGQDVWKDVTEAGLKIRPASQVGEGPWAELVAFVQTVDTQGKSVVAPAVVVRFERLKPDMQARAEALGYKAGDRVNLLYDPKGEKFSVLKPGPANQWSPQAQQSFDARLVFGLQCAWQDLNAKEQKEARKLGYAEGATVWKSSDEKGTLNLPGGKATVTALRIDGKLQLSVHTTGMLTVVSAQSAARPPWFRITHILYDQSKGEMTIRCLKRWEDLTESETSAALNLGYAAGDEVVFYFKDAANFQIVRKTVQALQPSVEPGAPQPGSAGGDRSQSVDGRLRFGMACPRAELNAKEQAGATQLGYAAGDTVWKSPNPDGALVVARGEAKGTAMKIDGKWRYSLDTEGMLSVVKPELAARPPLCRISHILHCEATGRIRTEFDFGRGGRPMTLRCLKRWEDLTESESSAATQLGYAQGDDVVFYFEDVNKFEIKRKMPEAETPAAAQHPPVRPPDPARLERISERLRRDGPDWVTGHVSSEPWIEEPDHLRVMSFDAKRFREISPGVLNLRIREDYDPPASGSSGPTAYYLLEQIVDCKRTVYKALRILGYSESGSILYDSGQTEDWWTSTRLKGATDYFEKPCQMLQGKLDQAAKPTTESRVPWSLTEQSSDGRLALGMKCAWPELSKKEQTQARKVGYKEGDYVWKSAGRNGKLNLPKTGKEYTGTIATFDGDGRIVYQTADLFEVVEPELAARPPWLVITHIFPTERETVVRCVKRWQDLTEGESKAALERKYAAGDDVIFYCRFPLSGPGLQELISKPYTGGLELSP